MGLKYLKFRDLLELILSEDSPIDAEEYASRNGESPRYDFNEDSLKNQNAYEFPRLGFGDKSSVKRGIAARSTHKAAPSMTERGKAFSALVASKSPEHVRPSTTESMRVTIPVNSP